MALVSVNVHNLYGRVWNSVSGNYEDAKFVFNPKHTYMVVFGPHQHNAEEKFVNDYGKHIIFKSKKACNKNYKNGPRNTLYIFELNEMI